MKRLLFLLISFSFSFYSIVFSQNFVDREIDEVAEKIASTLDAKNNFLGKKKAFKVLVVEDFRDTEGKVSVLGASLAQEFTLSLANEGISFSVTGAKNLAESSNPQVKINLNKVLNGLDKIADGLTDDENEEKNERNREASTGADGATDVATSIESNKNRYKGIDAVVAGTLTESNDQYRLLVKVISTRSGNAIIANAKGFITKTPFILKLEEEENKRRQLAAASAPRTVYKDETEKKETRGNGIQIKVEEDNETAVEGNRVVTTNKTKVELLKIKQVGQKIECHFRFTNVGPDVQFYLYSGGYYNLTKLIDTNNGLEYSATQVELGEFVNNGYVVKTLITNNPVTAKITFDGAATKVKKIARLTGRCMGHGGYFVFEMRDIVMD